MKFIKPKKLSMIDEQTIMEDTDPKDEVKPFKPSNKSMDQTIHLFEQIFDNMHNKRDFKQFAGVLLTGSPGTGKTTSINLLSKVLGI